ncbi:hypothetical protein K503DRAFT_546009 [Rhizopogon vinicolor AM-OR11-026]|uniref:Uncharacterized protein n=1 Tax=Rhizopogon vinicolor AM-OR11-026 TaxID=1314800 RepID=A0A1B7NGZ6_9AGAM|nr:hypothetical protein K503DRAFT_546009 [Rhizopogon vinicolor AM-OR11-026]
MILNIPWILWTRARLLSAAHIFDSQGQGVSGRWSDQNCINEPLIVGNVRTTEVSWDIAHAHGRFRKQNNHGSLSVRLHVASKCQNKVLTCSYFICPSAVWEAICSMRNSSSTRAICRGAYTLIFHSHSSGGVASESNLEMRTILNMNGRRGPTTIGLMWILGQSGYSWTSN